MLNLPTRIEYLGMTGTCHTVKLMALTEWLSGLTLYPNFDGRCTPCPEFDTWVRPIWRIDY
jgi:hypothetical protein